MNNQKKRFKPLHSKALPVYRQEGKVLPNFLLAIVIASLIWLASGFYHLRDGQVALLSFMGKPAGSVEKSGYSVPLLGDEIYNWTWPSPIGGYLILDKKKHRTFTAQFQQQTRQEFLTKDQKLMDVSVQVKYQIVNPQQFWQTYALARENERGEWVVNYAVISQVGDWMLNQNMNVLLEQKQINNQDLRERAQKQIPVSTSGIALLETQVSAFLPNRLPASLRDEVSQAQNQSLERLEKANLDAQATLNSVQKNASQIVQSAKASSEQLLVDAKTLPSRFNVLLPEYQKNSELTRDILQAQMLQKIIASASQITVDKNGVTIKQNAELSSDKKVPATHDLKSGNDGQNQSNNSIAADMNVLQAELFSSPYDAPAHTNKPVIHPSTQATQTTQVSDQSVTSTASSVKLSVQPKATSDK